MANDPTDEGWLDRVLLQSQGHSIVIIHPRLDVPWGTPTIARCCTNGATYTGKGQDAAEAVVALKSAIESNS